MTNQLRLVIGNNIIRNNLIKVYDYSLISCSRELEEDFFMLI
jgi:hypothetical protein